MITWILFALVCALAWGLYRLEDRCTDLEQSVENGRRQRARLLSAHSLMASQNAEVLEVVCIATEQFEHIPKLREQADDYRRLAGQFDGMLDDLEGEA